MFDDRPKNQKHPETLGFHVKFQLESSFCLHHFHLSRSIQSGRLFPKDVANELWFAADDLLTAGFLGIVELLRALALKDYKIL